MRSYTNENPVFSPSIMVPENTDPANADDVLSPPLEQIHDNVLALKEEIETGGGGNIGARVGACEQNILALALGLAIETGAEVDGTSDNIIVEVFDDTSGFIIASGMYDSTNHRLYA